MTLIGGQLVAIIVLLLLQKVFLTEAELKALGLAHPLRHRRLAGHLHAGHAAQSR